MRRRRAITVCLATPAVGLMLLLVHVGRVACMPVPLVTLVPLGLEDTEVSALGTQTEVGRRVLVGAYHVHTTQSDGRGDVDAVAKAAARANLDFVLLTDHNVEPPRPKLRHGVLMIPGVELSTSFGHVVAAGAVRGAGWTLRQEDPLGAARHAGGVVILAHPINRRLPWSGPFEGADGMEVVSGDSQFREAFARPLTRLLPGIATALGSSTIASLSLHHPSKGAFAVWDRHPGLIGLCAHDAHGYEGYYGPFSAMQLRVILDEPLPEDPAEAVPVFLRALGAGEVFCALGGLADPSGFAFEKTETGTVMASLRYRSWPKTARTRVILLHDGKEAASGEKEAVLEAAPPGVYRAEVHLEVPWIWSRREFLWIFTSTSRVE